MNRYTNNHKRALKNMSLKPLLKKTHKKYIFCFLILVLILKLNKKKSLYNLLYIK